MWFESEVFLYKYVKGHALFSNVFNDFCYRLYDSIIQCLTETRQLPDLQDDETVETELNAQITSYKAFR
jgi:hypothetical protein